MIARQAALKEGIVYYLESAAPADSACPVLFIHGWASAAHVYQACLTGLARRYRVIAPDLPGFGKSRRSRAGTAYEEYAQSLLSFVQGLQIRGLHVVGHSMGGGIAIRLATLRPSLVKSLILVDTAGIPLGSFAKTAVHRLAELAVQVRTAGFGRNHTLMLKAFMHNLLFRTKATIKTAAVAKNHDLRPLMPRIAAPCLILWGDRDRLIALKYGRQCAALIPGAALRVVEGGYHEWCLCMPETFSRLVAEFLDAVEKNP